MPEWKRDLLWSAVARMRDDDMETYRDSYHDDSDLVLEGLRSEGWLPWTPQDMEVGQDEDDGVPERATTTDTATQT
jgi:hypothetical protein